MSSYLCQTNPQMMIWPGYWSCPAIIINCGGTMQPAPTPGAATEPSPPPTETPTTPPPQETPKCSMARVDFLKLSVSDDGDTGCGDWTLVCEANGITQTKEYPDDYIDDDDQIPYDIGLSINVPIDEYTTNLQVKIYGFERDSGLNGENDKIPESVRNFSAAENFGLGQTFSMAAADDNIGYTATVRITCAKTTTFAIFKNQLVQNAKWQLERENLRLTKHKRVTAKITDAMAIDYAIRYLQRKGWQLKQVSGEAFVFEGLGRLPSLRMSDPRKVVSNRVSKPA